MTAEMKAFLTELADLFEKYNVEMDVEVLCDGSADGVDFYLGKSECITLERCAKAKQIRKYYEVGK